MALADALSYWDDMNTTQDNMDIQLLPPNAFDQQLWTIDVALADKIKDSSSSNPLVLQAIHQMKKELRLFNRSRAEDWTLDDGWLYYKTCLYVPELACHDLVVAAYSFFKGGHGGHLCTVALLSKDYWWPGLSTYVWKYISGCAVCQAHKVLTHPTVLAITPLAFEDSYPFQNLFVDLITSLPPVGGLDSVMVMVNHGLSKGVLLAPCTKTVNAAGIAQFFLIMSSNNSDYTKRLCLKQPINLTHLKVSPTRLLTRVEDKGGENQWIQESYSKSCWGNSKRTWLRFSGGDFGLYILLIMFVHDCMGSTNTVCIRQTLSPELWVQKLSRLYIEWKHRHVWCVRHQNGREEEKA